MKTNVSKSIFNNAASYSTDGSESCSLQKNLIEKTLDTNFLNAVEHRLKELWSEYVEYQDKNGLDETAKSLREKYFNLYQSYQRNKNWKQLISGNNNQEGGVL